MNWTHILIHHSATDDSGSVSWGAIEDYHTKTNGWRDIGYHFGVERINGRLYALVGRGLNEAGAHCYQQGMNDKAIGICVVGEFDKVAPDAETVDFLMRRLVIPLQKQFNIPAKNVMFHRDFAPKTCPGTMFTKDLIAKGLVP